MRVDFFIVYHRIAGEGNIAALLGDDFRFNIPALTQGTKASQGFIGNSAVLGKGDANLEFHGESLLYKGFSGI